MPRRWINADPCLQRIRQANFPADSHVSFLCQDNEPSVFPLIGVKKGVYLLNGRF